MHEQSFVCPSIRVACNMYTINYASNSAQHMNIYAELEANRMIFATTIVRQTDGQTDRNTEPKNLFKSQLKVVFVNYAFLSFIFPKLKMLILYDGRNYIFCTFQLFSTSI